MVPTEKTCDMAFDFQKKGVTARVRNYARVQWKKVAKMIHICMDYPEPWQYDLMAASDRTLVILTRLFHKLEARYGDKVQHIPQSIHVPFVASAIGSQEEPVEFASIPHPRLGYFGPVFGRLNVPLIRSVLATHPELQFLCFGVTEALKLPNVHSLPWQKPVELGRYVASFDLDIMPDDCFIEKSLHCAPLRLFDYFLAGLPVVSTPVIPPWEFEDLIYFGETAERSNLLVRFVAHSMRWCKVQSERCELKQPTRIPPKRLRSVSRNLTFFWRLVPGVPN